MLDLDRPVGTELSKETYARKIADGFFDRYLAAKAILDIGYKGGLDGIVPIVPPAIGIDVDYPGYDGKKLPFPDESQDAIYASHCLEHIKDYPGALRESYRATTKIGGYLVIVVPHQHLFERRLDLPSRWNADHYRFYTPASLLREIEEVLEPNSYRIRHLVDNDLGFDYSVTPLQAGVGCFEIELVLQKIDKPVWELDDGASRNYGASEFFSAGPVRKNNFYLETDFSPTDACVVYGPYVPLAAGNYEVRFFFEAIGIGNQEFAARIVFDVAQDVGRRGAASVTLAGAEGANAMRDGMVSLRFANDTPESVFDFASSHPDDPFKGR